MNVDARSEGAGDLVDFRIKGRRDRLTPNPPAELASGEDHHVLIVDTDRVIVIVIVIIVIVMIQ